MTEFNNDDKSYRYISNTFKYLKYRKEKRIKQQKRIAELPNIFKLFTIKFKKENSQYENKEILKEFIFIIKTIMENNNENKYDKDDDDDDDVLYRFLKAFLKIIKN